jgi:DNA polymerase-3 subunit gamma/tau
MFENVLGQDAVTQLASDLTLKRLAPSMLFWGPQASGKGTTALELARVLSCEAEGTKQGSWNCPCQACAAQRLLTHQDVLVLGKRSFSSEIAAAAAAYEREGEGAKGTAKLLFIRALRKLLLRFNPLLWEDDPKASRAAPLVEALDTGLDSLMNGGVCSDKQREALVKDAAKLEAVGISETIPVSQLRNATWWCRTAPRGKRKTLIIESAGRMQDAARNSLLKLLEEPPDTVTIVLCNTEAGALLPTIRSRLRPYRFLRREASIESDIIRRVFHDPDAASNGDAAGSLSDYLASFQAFSKAELEPLAADFYRLVTQPGQGIGQGVQAVMDACGKFESPDLFKRFLETLLAQVDVRNPVEAERFRRLVSKAAIAEGSYNQSPALVLEALAVDYRQIS